MSSEVEVQVGDYVSVPGIERAQVVDLVSPWKVMISYYHTDTAVKMELVVRKSQILRRY